MDDSTTDQRNISGNVFTVASAGSTRYSEGLQVTEHFVSNGLRRTGSAPKPMTVNTWVTKPK